MLLLLLLLPLLLLAEELLGKGKFLLAGDFEGDFNLRGLGGYSSSEREGEDGLVFCTSASASTSASTSEEDPSSSVSSPRGTGGAP